MKADDKAATTLKEMLIGKDVSDEEKRLALTQALIWYKILSGIWEMVNYKWD